jgi:hypothetical protein
LKAEVGDGAVNTAQADREMGLTELLGDDVGGGVRVKELVAHDLFDELFGASVIGLGAGFLGFKGLQAAFLEVLKELIVSLAAAAVFLGGGGDVAVEALALREHEEAVGQQVSVGDGQGAGGAGELVSQGVELE